MQGGNPARLPGSEEDAEHANEAHADFRSSPSGIAIVEEHYLSTLLDSKTERFRFSGMEPRPDGGRGRFLQWGNAQPPVTECGIERSHGRAVAEPR